MIEAPKMIDAIDKSTIVLLAREFMQSGISGLAAVSNMNKVVLDELWSRVLGAI
jgi:UTP-glucose-1-phosphate uridylyltransferase